MVKGGTLLHLLLFLLATDGESQPPCSSSTSSFESAELLRRRSVEEGTDRDPAAQAEVFAAYRRALACDPEDGQSWMRLAFLSPNATDRSLLPRAPASFVSSHFDELSSHFDALMADIEYNAAKGLAALVHRTLKRDEGAQRIGDGSGSVGVVVSVGVDVEEGWGRVLDLGCGSGLLGEALASHRPRFASLLGVDLSTKMMQRARERRLGGTGYSSLLEADIVAFLTDPNHAPFPHHAIGEGAAATVAAAATEEVLVSARGLPSQHPEPSQPSSSQQHREGGGSEGEGGGGGGGGGGGVRYAPFDLVVMADVSGYLGGDTRRAVAAAARWLRPGGLLGLSLELPEGEEEEQQARTIPHGEAEGSAAEGSSRGSAEAGSLLSGAERGGGGGEGGGGWVLPRRSLRFAHHLDSFKVACCTAPKHPTSHDPAAPQEEAGGSFWFEVAAEEPAATLRFDSGVPVRGALLVLRRLPLPPPAAAA